MVQTTWLTFVRRRSRRPGPGRRRGLAHHDRPPRGLARRRARPTAAPVEDEDLRRCFRDGPRRRTRCRGHANARVWAAVDGLPERCRRLLRIVAFENRPDYAALAAQLGMPVGSIGPTRGRCLAKLRVALMQVGELG